MQLIALAQQAPPLPRGPSPPMRTLPHEAPPLPPGLAPPHPSASTGSERLLTCRTCWGLDLASAPGLLCSSLSE